MNIHNHNALLYAHYLLFILHNIEKNFMCLYKFIQINVKKINVCDKLINFNLYFIYL